MKHHDSVVAVGAFVMGAIVILAITLLFFTGGDIFRPKKAFVMYFDRSIQGLEPGAPMKLRGVKIGEVTGIQSHFVEKSMEVINAVHVEVILGQTQYEGSLDSEELLDTLIEDHGLRAQLKVQSFLTGLLYVEVDFKGWDAPKKLWHLHPDISEFPTLPSEIDKISDIANDIDFADIAGNIQQISDNIARFTGDPALLLLAENLNTTLRSVNGLARNTDEILMRELTSTIGALKNLLHRLGKDYQPLVDQLSQSLTSAQQSLSKLDGAADNARYLLSDDSQLLYEITKTLAEIQRAATKMADLAESLERQPEALIRGKSNR